MEIMGHWLPGGCMTIKNAEYWELHVTMECTGKERAMVDALTGWTYSNITDDPILGPGAKCYATRHFHIKQPEQFVVDAVRFASSVLKQAGANVLRRKVERVVYDEVVS